MNKTIEKNPLNKSILVRNTLLNFIGQAVTLLVGVITIPFIVRRLGMERYGLLALTWVILGYSSIFDLGMGRATTKFVAEAFGKGEKYQISQIVWTTVTIQVILGIVSALALFGATPFLIKYVFNIPPELISEAKFTFYLISLSIPIVLLSGSFRGVLEATQRFDLVNAVSIPMNTLTFFLPLVGLLLGFSLLGIVALVLLARAGALATFLKLNLCHTPELKQYSMYFPLFHRLFSFGGWITVTSIASPILIYLDRFLISSILTIDAVAYYTIPYEAVTRLWIIPASLSMTLFPTFSTLEGLKDRRKLRKLFVNAVKYIMLALGPIVLIVWLFAKEMLQIWLGGDFVVKSTPTLQILAFGVLINSLAHVPFVFLQGAGRPDLPAKLHLLELPIYIGIAWLLISKWGINGAATAWTIRVICDAFLLFVIMFKVYRFSPRLFTANGTTLLSLSLLLLGGTAYGIKALISVFSWFIQVAFFAIIFGLFAWFIWRKVLNVSDKSLILKMIKP